RPVMVSQVVAGLEVKSGHWYVDATVGGGGHALAILKAGGKLLGLDQDLDALKATQQRLEQADFSVRVDDITLDHGGIVKSSQPSRRDVDAILVQGNFAHLSDVAGRCLNQPAAGVLFDLGVS